MRRLYPDSARTRQAALLRRLPRRWAATALIVAAVALLAPGEGVTTAGQPHQLPMTERAAITPSRPAGPGSSHW